LVIIVKLINDGNTQNRNLTILELIDRTLVKLNENHKKKKGIIATVTILIVYKNGKKRSSEIMTIPLRSVHKDAVTPRIKKLLEWWFLVSPNHISPRM
jgi:hypothetical protein